jgi:large subunit ribosomal protein L3
MEKKMNGLLGKKIGMTRIFDETGKDIPVTVIQAGPCYITQIKTKETDGYRAVQLGFDEKKEKNITKPQAGHFKSSGVSPLRWLKEFPVRENLELKPGDVQTVDVFNQGEIVKVSGLSKGKGFTGVVKRWGFRGGPKTHGQSDRLRAPGSVGQSSSPSRVFKGIKMGGRKGGKRISVLGLKVIKVDPENNLLFVKGSVPGARNSYLEIRKG